MTVSCFITNWTPFLCVLGLGFTFKCPEDQQSFGAFKMNSSSSQQEGRWALLSVTTFPSAWRFRIHTGRQQQRGQIHLERSLFWSKEDILSRYCLGWVYIHWTFNNYNQAWVFISSYLWESREVRLSEPCSLRASEAGGGGDALLLGSSSAKQVDTLSLSSILTSVCQGYKYRNTSNHSSTRYTHRTDRGVVVNQGAPDQ